MMDIEMVLKLIYGMVGFGVVVGARDMGLKTTTVLFLAVFWPVLLGHVLARIDRGIG